MQNSRDFDFSSSGSLLGKQLIKPLVFYPALLQWLKIKVPTLRGRHKGKILAVLPLPSALLRGLGAVVPLFLCPQTPFDRLHIRDLLFFFIFFVSSIVLHEDWKIFEPHHAKMCLRGFSTKSDSNQPAQLQKLATILKFWIKPEYISYYLSSEQKRCWSDCADAQADLHLCCSHMA